CLRAPGDGPQRRQEVRTFGTTTRELLRLADWLSAAGCTHVAMESTGIYWRPVYNILEGSFELSVVNAQHVKMVPGRKTDVRDSEWLARLLELGLLRRSFVPPAAPRELRDVVRYRKRLIEERAREANRVEKVLGTANIKLGSVVTTVLGVSARAMLKALITGEGAPEQLADLAKRRLRRKPPSARRSPGASRPTTASSSTISCATSSSSTAPSPCAIAKSRRAPPRTPMRSPGSTRSPASPAARPR